MLNNLELKKVKNMCGETGENRTIFFISLSNFLYIMFQCNPGVGLRSFFELVHNGPKKVIIFPCTNGFILKSKQII